MNFRKTAIAGLALAAALTMSACGSDDEKPTANSTAVTTSNTAPATSMNLPTLPTAADLNELVKKGLDPNVPAADKVALVQGAQQDPELFNQVAAAAAAANATIEVVEPVVDNFDGTLSASLIVTLNGQPSASNVTFVAEDGAWKLSKDNACAIVALASLTSPACPK